MQNPSISMSSFSSFSSASSQSSHQAELEATAANSDAIESSHLQNISTNHFKHVATPILERISPSITDNSGWDLAAHKDNIKVYTHDVLGSGYKAIRGELNVKGKLDQIIAIAKNPIRIPELLSSVAKVNMLDNVEPSYKHLELVSESYWSIPARIIFCEYEYHHHREDNAVHIKLARTDRYAQAPHTEGVVVPSFESNILFRETSFDLQTRRSQIEVYFENYLVPGGFIRPFIINPLTVNQAEDVMGNINRKIQNME